MNQTPEQLDRFWNNLLSRQPELIRAEFGKLDASSRKFVLAHLQRMASEAGWQPEQRQSATAALQALVDHPNQEEP